MHFSQSCIFRSARDRIKPRREKCATSQISIGILLRSILIKLIDIDYIFSSFYSKYTKISNKHVSIKQTFRRQLKRFSKPWITQGIRASIKTKNKLFASDDRTKNKFYRNEINHVISISKRGYFHNYFEKNLTNMKKTWEALNNILNRKTKESRQVNAIKDFNNGNKINRNPQRIANSGASARAKARAWSSILKRKFGYEVTVRPSVRTLRVGVSRNEFLPSPLASFFPYCFKRV